MIYSGHLKVGAFAHPPTQNLSADSMRWLFLAEPGLVHTGARICRPISLAR
jgi:hypothetical protein